MLTHIPRRKISTLLSQAYNFNQMVTKDFMGTEEAKSAVFLPTPVYVTIASG